MRGLILTAVTLACLAGCGRQPAVKPFDIRNARDVSLEALERETRDLPYFLLWGRTNGFHYFGRPDGAVFRLPESVTPLPRETEWELGTAALYVTIQNGRITVPRRGHLR